MPMQMPPPSLAVEAAAVTTAFTAGTGAGMWAVTARSSPSTNRSGSRRSIRHGGQRTRAIISPSTAQYFNLCMHVHRTAKQNYGRVSDDILYHF
jgi:hypothetical protein